MIDVSRLMLLQFHSDVYRKDSCYRGKSLRKTVYDVSDDTQASPRYVAAGYNDGPKHEVNHYPDGKPLSDDTGQLPAGNYEVWNGGVRGLICLQLGT